MLKPFSVIRVGPLGPDSHKHLFSICAMGNKQLVDSGDSYLHALLSGAGGTDPKATKAAVQNLRDALNAQFDRYERGEFHDTEPTVLAVEQPLSQDQSEAIQGAVERAMSFDKKADGTAMSDADWLALWHVVKGEGPSTSRYLVEKPIVHGPAVVIEQLVREDR